MTTYPFNFDRIDNSWQECLQRGLSNLDPTYLQQLQQSTDWLPGPDKIFNAFSLPLHKVRFVLFGESPYPRRESANGYAFWDEAVQEIWSPTGLSTRVNRATSLRNIIKMLLVSEGVLDGKDASQPEIAKINKQPYIQTNQQLFQNLLQHGFLLLNATPVLQHTGKPQKDARAWFPFMRELLNCLLESQKNIKFVLLGRIANTVDALLKDHHSLEKLYAEHPYNHSFITNKEVLAFFKPLRLLQLKV